MFLSAVATAVASKGTFSSSVGRLCLRSLSRPLCNEISTKDRFVLPENWSEKVRAKADFTQLKGKVYVLRDATDEGKLLRSSNVLQDFQKQEALGLDVEFMPHRGGVKVCLVQLACHDVAVLWNCRHVLSRPPPVLVSILMDSNILKVGHASQQDARYIHRYCHINVKSVVDTLCWARDMSCSHLSLRAMCALFLNLRLAKDMQRSNWDVEELSERQIRYAATDAWVSLRVFEEMRRKAKQLSIPLTPKFDSCEAIMKEITSRRREGRKRRVHARKERARGQKELEGAADDVDLSADSATCGTGNHGEFAEEKLADSAGTITQTRTEKNRKKRHRYNVNKRLRKSEHVQVDEVTCETKDNI